MPPISTFQADALNVRVYADATKMAQSAARGVHSYLAELLAKQGSARVILASGNSQLLFLDELIALGGLDWSKVTLFHMDEYLGISADHPASFCRYMREKVESRVHAQAFHYIKGDALEPIRECERYTHLLWESPTDLCMMGIGDNGHLAFNDPPVADFDDHRAVKIVQLDLGCKQQQVTSGHFPNLESVPPYALTLTVPSLCAAKRLVILSPGKRKAVPVRNALRGPISTDCPASILRKQAHATLLLDTDAASLL